MRPKRTVRAAAAAPFETLGTLLSSHRAATRVTLAAISFTVIIAFNQQAPVTQAGPEPAPFVPESLLPETVGVGVSTGEPITIDFDAAMNPGSVDEVLQVLPAQPVELLWSEDLEEVSIAPERRWRTDESYLIVIGGSAVRADGQAISNASRHAFTTQTAPVVSDFQVRLAADNVDRTLDADAEEMATAALDADAVAPAPEGSLPPTMTAEDVSASSAITVSFSQPMNPADVVKRFSISPDVPGELTWEARDLVFRPSERLEPGTRYTISVIGSHSLTGNVLGGKGNFSFIVQQGAQVTKTHPDAGAAGVEPKKVELWFSQPMDMEATDDAFALTDSVTGNPVGGDLDWNEAGTQLVYTPDKPFAAGRKFSLAFDGGARDADGNTVKASLSFTTKAAPVIPRATTSTRTAPPPPPPAPAATRAPAPPPTRAPAPPPAPAPVVPPTAPSSSMAGYAVNQINASRAAYGFAPVVLDASITAVAYAHAHDQAANNYFSHTGRNGSSRESRLRAGGVSFSWSGENQCYLVGRSVQGTLDWCHGQFMAEPYPGHWNHIANVLNPNARRVGVGIAQVGSKIVVVWDFTN